MVMSRDALKATDQARGPGEIRAIVPCELVHEPMINRSVVTSRLLIRAPNCGVTANNEGSQKDHSEEKRVFT